VSDGVSQEGTSKDTGVERVGVVGCGLMGSGIAEVCVRAGKSVIVCEASDELVAAGRKRIEASMNRAVTKEKLGASQRDAALARLAYTTTLDDLADAHLIIEAIIEDLEAKRATFRRLAERAPRSTIFASNTSSLAISDIAAATTRADRFVGLHFFNPVPVMALVEVVRTLVTADDAFDRALEFVKEIGKVPIAAKDNSGFVVNLLLVPFMLDAIRQLERGVATISDIDTAMVLGCGHPMGPLTLCDFVGLDTLLRISEIMYEEHREERYAPPPLLRRLVTLGRYGKKNGRGFYDWSQPEPVPLAL
jgi:3-hydroxybutyryl-CoA dehydrogenase